MVRIIIDKAGVAVDDIILEALVSKCKAQGLYVTGSTIEASRAIIIISTDQTGDYVVSMLRAQERASVCGGCGTVHIRGTLPPPTIQPFRCPCGKYIGAERKPKI